ncbi:hypothetical protein EV379_1256 [Microterricola gilva]|uniref:Pectate lyase-like protein n=1 Tax=Microterricola gilva TaxID=393267 RepID=A0A4Q8AM19_9MICO|nr:hypothetical protein [Microterricola gilva]RZU64945.1 hypothetical protein EV379_1256 [Microterricola gilva]
MTLELITNIMGPQGPIGPMGPVNPDSAPTDEAIGEWVGVPSETRTALLKNGLTGWLHVDGFGAKHDAGVTDSTLAIRAALDAASHGDTIYFPGTGPGAYYKITDTITVTKTNIRFMGAPRDAYASSIRCNVAGKTMILVKAAGFVMENVGLVGDGAIPLGAGATVTGLEVWGDNDGNCDAVVRGTTFQQLKLGARTRGRNVNFDLDTMFSNCLEGIAFDGPDAVFHTGPNREDIRGHAVKNCRFHTNGTLKTHAVIRFTPASKTNGAIVRDNFFDAGGQAAHIVAEGEAATPATSTIRGLSLKDNVHHQVENRAYDLKNVLYSWIDNPNIIGSSSGGVWSEDAILLTNVSRSKVKGVSGNVIGRSGIKMRGCSVVSLKNIDFDSVGMDTAAGTFDVLDVDSTNDQILISDVTANGAPGYGFNGNPTGSALYDGVFVSCVLGTVNSDTVLNKVQRGSNSFVENKHGRLEDIGYKGHDFSSGVAKPVATIATGGNLAGFLLEVEVTAQNGAPLNAYLFARRYVNPNNGAPIVTTLGADAASGVTLTITGTGANVSVSVTVGGTTFGSVRLRTSAPSGSGAVNKRQAAITML